MGETIGRGDTFLDFRIENEPWYVSTRASQMDRFEKAVALVREHCRPIGVAYDIGCADGQFSARIAALADRVVALDSHPGRISGNRKRYRDIANLTFTRADVLRDPLPKESADLASALEILYYFDKWEQETFMARIREILKPGGHLLLSVNVFSGSRFTETSVRNLLERHFEMVGQKPIHRNAYYRLELRVIRFIDELNYLEKLRIFTPNILKLSRNFYPGRWNRFLLRPSTAMDRIAIPAARWGALRLIGSRGLYAAITELTRILSPERGKSQVLFLARKEKTNAGN